MCIEDMKYEYYFCDLGVHNLTFNNLKYFFQKYQRLSKLIYCFSDLRQSHLQNNILLKGSILKEFNTQCIYILVSQGAFRVYHYVLINGIFK